MAVRRALRRAGSSRLARMAMIAITTNSSIRVNLHFFMVRPHNLMATIKEKRIYSHEKQ